jgi:hydrocephalus-inducing protein
MQVAPSDYLSSSRRPAGLPGPTGDTSPLDPETMAIEIESLGVGVRNVKRFSVHNPTGTGYEFVWEAVAVPGRNRDLVPFRCLSPRGSIAPGKRYEMTFEFLPCEDRADEAFWTFCVPSQVCRPTWCWSLRQCGK